jgi:hypothetical protein
MSTERPLNRQEFANKIIRAVASDGASILWRGDTIEIETFYETITIVFDRRRKET